MELQVNLELLALELHGLAVELDIKRQAHILLVRDIAKLEANYRHIHSLIEEVRRAQTH